MTREAAIGRPNYWLLLERGFNPAYVFVCTAAISRIFSPDAVGNLATCYLTIVLGNYLINFGTDQDFQVLLANCRETDAQHHTTSELFRRVRRLLAPLASIAALLTFIPLPDTAMYAFIGLVAGMIQSATMPVEIYLTINRNFRCIVLVKTVSSSAALTAFALIGLSFHTLMPAILALVGVEKCLTTLILSKLATRDRPDGVVSDSGKDDYYRNNVPVIISGVAVFIYNRLDQFYVLTVVSAKDLGVYFATLKFFDVINLVTSVLITSDIKKLAAHTSTEEEEYRILRKVFYTNLLLVCSTIVLMPWLLQVLLNIEPPEDSRYVIFLAAATFFGALGSIKGPWVAKNRRYRFNTYCTTFGAVMSSLVLFVIQPRTLTGIAFAVALGQFIVNVGIPMMADKERYFLKKLVNL